MRVKQRFLAANGRPTVAGQYPVTRFAVSGDRYRAGVSLAFDKEVSEYNRSPLGINQNQIIAHPLGDDIIEQSLPASILKQHTPVGARHHTDLSLGSKLY